MYGPRVIQPETPQAPATGASLKSSGVTERRPRRNPVLRLVGQDDVVESGRSRPVLGLCLQLSTMM